MHPPAQGNATPSGSGNKPPPFRGRCPRLLSCALAGHEKPTPRLYPAAPHGRNEKQILRPNKNGGLSRNSMNYSFQLSNLGRADRKVFYLLFAPPERPRHFRPVIPGGDRSNSRGQRPRKTPPQQGPTPQARGRIRVASHRSCVPRLRVMRPLQGRGTNVAHSGGGAPGYYLVPLQGTKNLPLGLTPRHPMATTKSRFFVPIRMADSPETR